MSNTAVIELNGQQISADTELIPLLKALNDVGLITTKHCSGHGDEPAWVVLNLKNVPLIEVRQGESGRELKIMWDLRDWSLLDKLPGALTKEEAEFVLTVYRCPGSKLDWGIAWRDEGDKRISNWKKPEELGLIKCSGSYKWEPTAKLTSLLDDCVQAILVGGGTKLCDKCGQLPDGCICDPEPTCMCTPDFDNLQCLVCHPVPGKKVALKDIPGITVLEGDPDQEVILENADSSKHNKEDDR